MYKALAGFFVAFMLANWALLVYAGVVRGFTFKIFYFAFVNSVLILVVFALWRYPGKHH